MQKKTPFHEYTGRFLQDFKICIEPSSTVLSYGNHTLELSSTPTSVM